MEFFQKLGALVESKWRDRNYDEHAFPDIAMACLAELPPSAHVTPLDVATWMQSATVIPRQVGDGSFGQPPLTVYAGARFYIEVLYWLDGTTAIHQHAFSGAFHVLDGSSIHSSYGFDSERRVNSMLHFGAIKLRLCEYLKKGDIRPILAGRDFIHSLFHLDHPSVSVVVRTYNDLEAGPQYRYSKPRVAVASMPLAEGMKRKLWTLNMMREIKHPETDRLLAEMIASANLHESFIILEDLFGRIQEWDKFCFFVEKVGTRHGDVWKDFVDIFAEDRRQQKIASRRRHTQSPEHRFFLALLLNVPSRVPLFDLVKKRFPDRDPTDAVLAWITEMSQTSDSADNNALGIPMDDGAIAILGGLLHGFAGERLKTRLLEEYDASDVEALAPEIEELSVAFRESELFRPLFAD